MIEYDGEAYVTASEIAVRFGISRATCYNNLLRHLQKCYLPGRKCPLYRQAEVEQFADVRTDAEHHRSVFPASPLTAPAGNGVTSSSNLPSSTLDWQGQYSPSSPQTQHLNPWTISALEITPTTQKGLPPL